MASFTNDDDDGKFNTTAAAAEDFVSNFGEFDVFSPNEEEAALAAAAAPAAVTTGNATAPADSGATATATAATTTTTTATAAANTAAATVAESSTAAPAPASTTTTAAAPQSVAPTMPPLAINSADNACRLESALPSIFTVPARRQKYRGSTMPVARLSLSGVALNDLPHSEDENDEKGAFTGGGHGAGAAGVPKSKVAASAAPAPPHAAATATTAANATATTSATTSATPPAAADTATSATTNAAGAPKTAALNPASKPAAPAAAAAVPKPEPLTLSEAREVLEAATKALHPAFAVPQQAQEKSAGGAAKGAASAVTTSENGNNCGRIEDVSFIATFVASHLQGELCNVMAPPGVAKTDATTTSKDSASGSTSAQSQGAVDVLTGGYSSLWLCGRPGTGKTHTVAEAIRTLQAHTPSSTSTSSTALERGGSRGGKNSRSQQQQPQPSQAAAVPEFVPVCLNASSFVSDPQDIYLELHRVLSSAGSGLLSPKRSRHNLDDSDAQEEARKGKHESMTFKSARYELDRHFNALCDVSASNSDNSSSKNKKKRKADASPEVPGALPCVLVSFRRIL